MRIKEESSLTIEQTTPAAPATPAAQPLRAELLSPAGDFERLRAAFRYGADAVYLAGKEFGMRSASPNFGF